jgi:acyl-CoA synthetase (AMP-forming)/AMP-acid ligase II
VERVTELSTMTSTTIDRHRQDRPPTPLGGVGFAAALAAHGERPALVRSDGLTVSYTDLAGRVTEVGRRLGATRRLVMLDGGTTVEALVVYLAALAGGHPVLVVPPGRSEHTPRLCEVYAPDVVALADDGWAVVEQHPGTVHDLHPELALLLSTSGSTGSPKVVRLSRTNVESNAAAIAEYLGLTTEDRAVTSLPMHYCYGLSVVHSHLLVGASLVLNDLSVTEPCFWERVREHRVTSLAGVPHTFDLLDRVRFADMDLPHLRYLTQAGGRMAPDRVRRYAELGRRKGFELFVMYGQTEATARMAYLPPGQVLTHPGAVGRPIPGGAFDLDRSVVPEDGEHTTGVGELVYRGPNVMMGYAEGPEDLALGRTVHELRTGDLARRNADGLYEIVGRASRFVKLFGLRIDLDRCEQLLRDVGIEVVCAGTDDAVVVAIEGRDGAGDRVGERARVVLADDLGVPRSSIVVWVADELPRLASGKPDLRAIAGEALEDRSEAAAASCQGGPAAAVSGVASSPVRAALAEALDLRLDDIGEADTFVGLGGDSLSYVEVSVTLEAVVGRLPEAWHLLPVAELEALVPSTPGPSRSLRARSMEGNVVVRAIAIALVVGSHAGAFTLIGGAHVLLAVAGYNYARFRLPAVEPAHPTRQTLASIARIAVPAGLWAAFQVTYAERFHPSRLLFVNNHLGTGFWVYWYVEALLQILVVLALVFAVPQVRALERRHPGLVAVAVLTAAVALRMFGSPIETHVHPMHLPETVFWCFAIGWAAQRASGTVARLALSAVAWWGTGGFFYGASHEMVVLVGILVVIWVPRISVPWPANRLVAALAAASLYIYLVHFAVLRQLDGLLPPSALAVAGLAAGWVAFVLAGRAEAAIVGAWRARRSRQTASRSVAAAANCAMNSAA